MTGKNPSKFTKDNGAGPDYPVEQVSWDNAIAFCKMLSELPEEKSAGRVYRLPTEAEWEYACRAGSQSIHPFGDDPRLLDEYAWHPGNAGERTQPVGRRRPNAWGLHDILGNVAEWCFDFYANDYYRRSPHENPKGPDSGGDHVNRGESFTAKYNSRNLRCAVRHHTDRAHESLGFRVVCEIRPARAQGQ